MIFYDQKQRRKIYFRVGIISAVVVIVLSGIDVFFRIVSADDSNSVAEKTPHYYSQYYSKANEKKVTLTFDDGPDPVYTRQIIEILEKENVPATFFMIGRSVMRYSDVVREVHEAGFEIGSHTFTHSELAHSSVKRFLWELNATETVIENITGERPVFYRPPFLLDIGTDPTINPDIEVHPILEFAARSGSIPIGADIDPKDWRSHSPEQILINIKEQIESENRVWVNGEEKRDNGHIVLLHDSGGKDVENTIAALPALIGLLRSQGYEFVTLSELLIGDVNTLVQNASAVSLEEKFLHVPARSIFFGIIIWTGPFFAFCISFLTILILVRIAIVLVLFILSHVNRQVLPQKGAWEGKVSVVIPAFNEEDNIESTVRSILQSTFQIFEVIVVDDGSKDKTSSIVRKLIKEYAGVLKLVRVKNGGKARALNRGFLETSGEVVIALDGDTIYDRNTIAYMVRHFVDPQVAAVAGKVDIVRQKSIMGMFQTIEYVIGQNIEKKAFTVVNGIGVVPGPVGAWRRIDVVSNGGYSSDTLVEDQDLTLQLLSAGKRIVYEPRAVAYTEAPHSVRDFIKQRFRWVFGTLQCTWKYSGFLGSMRAPGLGWLVIPNAIAQTIVSLFSPLVDVLAVIGVINGYGAEVFLAFMFFSFLDFFYASIAFQHEKGKRHLLFALPAQRFFYRQVMYYIFIRSLIRAIEGRAMLWNKVKRHGHASEYFARMNKAPVNEISPQ